MNQHLDWDSEDEDILALSNIQDDDFPNVPLHPTLPKLKVMPIKEVKKEIARQQKELERKRLLEIEKHNRKICVRECGCYKKKK